MAKLAVARIKLLRNKREVVVRQMRRDIALLLQSGQDATARIRIEHVIREQNIMAANEIIEVFCELVVARLSIISKQRECPKDLKEGISSLIFSAPRCADIPELVGIRNIFEKKYGRDFVSAATDLRPDCGVNRTLIEKLSVNTPSGEVKLKLMKEIAKEYQVEWDTKDSEMELLNPPEEELIEGPRVFVSATSLPVDPSSVQHVEPNRSSNRKIHKSGNPDGPYMNVPSSRKTLESGNPNGPYMNAPSPKKVHLSGTENINNSKNHSMPSWRTYYTPQDTDNEETGSTDLESLRVHRRHSYTNGPVGCSDITFDKSDGSVSEYDEEIEMETPSGSFLPPPDRPAPPLPPSHHDNRTLTDKSYRRNSLPNVHPKLPDYEELSARFEALRTRKS
ncbi:hypothetical protein GIB67_007010 [Kingdonia uniflora]|uniref:IST1-like protein n=1 Tax=Kingdonia uniflora TaxID=39325 RepID=A0A7J7NZ94_9MAGN|nr:hypothetical protein GIB67_007010 [Kingdonia uniflora]